MRGRLGVIGWGVVLLAGCAQTPPDVVIRPVPTLTPIEAKQSKLLFLSDAAVNLAAVKFGQMSYGASCSGAVDLKWTSPVSTNERMTSQIRKAFKKHGYNAPYSLIKTQAEDDADILIGAGLTGMQVNICTTPNGQKGEVYEEITWQVFDKRNKKTLALQTRGTSRMDKATKDGLDTLLNKALAHATENFLARTDVHAMLDAQ